MTEQASDARKAAFNGEDVDEEMASIFEEEPMHAQQAKEQEAQQSLGGTLE